MPVQFEWKVQEQGADQTIAEIRPWSLPGWVVKTARVVLVGMVVIVGGVWAVLRLRYVRAREKALTAVEDVIALEAQSFLSGDTSLFLSLQDAADSEWYALQRFRVGPDCADGPACPNPRFPALCADEFSIDLPREQTLQRLCSPPLPAQVADLELRGNVAWVEVIEAQPLVRRVRFYKKTSTGWKHTAPQPEFWGKPVRQVRGPVTVHYRRRDQPHVDPTIEHVAQTAEAVRSTLRYWPSQGRLDVEFATQTTALQAPYVLHRPGSTRSTLILPSPWLSGIPISGTLDDSAWDQLTFWSTYGLLAGGMQRAAGDGSLSQLQKALVSEYIAYSVHRDKTRAPILGRIVDRHGEQELSRVFLSLRGAYLTGLFLSRWLSVHPKDPAYMELLLDIEQEAILSGQRETFLLVQDQDWQSQQASYFHQSQITNPYDPGPVQVLSVEFQKESARAQLLHPPAPLPNHPLQTLDGYAYFYRRNWDWKRASTELAAQWTHQPSASPEPTRVPPRTEDAP